MLSLRKLVAFGRAYAVVAIGRAELVFGYLLLRFVTGLRVLLAHRVSPKRRLLIRLVVLIVGTAFFSRWTLAWGILRSLVLVAMCILVFILVLWLPEYLTERNVGRRPLSLIVSEIFMHVAVLVGTCVLALELLHLRLLPGLAVSLSIWVLYLLAWRDVRSYQKCQSPNRERD